MVAALADQELRRARRSRIMVAALTLVGVGVYLRWQPTVAALPGGMFVVAFMFGIILLTVLPRALMCVPRTVLLPAEYFSITGARMENGKPRCIWCGHVGVYTHGAYAVSTKYHDCSGCGKTMYVS